VPVTLLKATWLAATALALVAVLHRLGLRGWWRCLAAVGCVLVVEPVRETLQFGQVNVFLLAMVVLDLVPGPRLLPRLVPGLGRGRRLLPVGVLTGLAAAIKLTPALFVVYLVLSRQWRAARAAVATFAGAMLVGAVVLPEETVGFWRLLLAGDIRWGYEFFLFNQSVLAAVERLTGVADGAAYLGLGLGAVAGVAGAWAAARWHARGHPLCAVAVCGVGTLLASPLSWTHHFVWVVPLGFLVADRRIPPSLRGLAAALAVWSSAAVFKQLPWGEEIERTYDLPARLLSALTPALGLALVVLALVTARTGPRWPGGDAAPVTGRTLVAERDRRTVWTPPGPHGSDPHVSPTHDEFRP
jgi:alpha-1,2-mannosyltransferase